MTNIVKLEFLALKSSGDNYMPWTANIKRHLKSMGVIEAINENNTLDDHNRTKADVFIHKHIDEILQLEYFNHDNPSVLWKELKSRFDHQRDSLLPAAKAEWNSLRFQDFKKVNDYTSTILNICSRLEYCGQIMSEADKLEKNLLYFSCIKHNFATTITVA
ncbi:uncharacterized protein LOC143600386 [Bidens hawaiensis]|uniref:uncharacterized protein LOC143600386 n=1 Tax=Bidens hawaiensis TaxID=980011 RepID=UPI00404ABB5D